MRAPFPLGRCSRGGTGSMGLRGRTAQSVERTARRTYCVGSGPCSRTFCVGRGPCSRTFCVERGPRFRTYCVERGPCSLRAPLAPAARFETRKAGLGRSAGPPRSPGQILSQPCPPPRQKPPHRPVAIGGPGAVGQSRRKRKMSGPTVTCGPTNPGPTKPGPTNPGPPALAAPAPPSNAGRTRFLQKEEGYPATHNPPWIASPWGEAPPGVAPAGRRAPESWPPG